MDSRERPSSFELEEIRAEIPRREGFLPALLVLAVASIFIFAVCTPRGSSQDVTLSAPPPPSAGTAETDANTAQERTFQMLTVLPPNAIPAILSPQFVAAEDAERWMLPDEPVIGVEIDGEARAYSTFMLSRHEIVNDAVGGRPIAVTW